MFKYTKLKLIFEDVSSAPADGGKQTTIIKLEEEEIRHSSKQHLKFRLSDLICRRVSLLMKMSQNNAEKDDQTSSNKKTISLPISRVRLIMKSSPDVSSINQDALFLTTKATVSCSSMQTSLIHLMLTGISTVLVPRLLQLLYKYGFNASFPLKKDDVLDYFAQVSKLEQWCKSSSL